jgi:hypothetical protein
MSNAGETKLFQEFLNLLAEEQHSPTGTPTAKDDVKRREYRCQRIRELASWLGSAYEAKS